MLVPRQKTQASLMYGETENTDNFLTAGIDVSYSHSMSAFGGRKTNEFKNWEISSSQGGISFVCIYKIVVVVVVVVDTEAFYPQCKKQLAMLDRYATPAIIHV
jgi:hypothetical protein